MYHSKENNKALLKSLVDHYGPQNIRIVFDFLTKDFVDNPKKIDDEESKRLGKEVKEAQVVNKYAQFKTGYTKEEIKNLADELGLITESIDPISGEIKQLLDKTGLKEEYEIPYTSKYQLCTVFKPKTNKQTSNNDTSLDNNDNFLSNN